MPVPPVDDALISSAEDDEAQILDAIRKWLDRDVRPRVLELEHGDIYPTAMVEQMKAFGLFGATIAPEYGGLGMPTSTYARMVTLISEVWIALPGAFNTHLIMAALVERFGTAAQKRRFPAALCHGRAARRPGADRSRRRHRPAGDPHPRRARRRPLPDQRRQDVDHQRHRGLLLCAAGQDRPAAEPRHRGMSLFLAEKGPGFRVGRRLDKLGYHGSDTAELFFEDYRVPADRLIGGAEGHGLPSGDDRARARPDQRRGAQRRPRQCGARGFGPLRPGP